MSSETNQAARLLNPSIFHLQKLGLELKCPLCMNLLNNPILLPCNHIFCKGCIPEMHQIKAECAACRHCFTNKEIRPASYMENIVGIYKSLNATFNSAVMPFLSAGGLELTKKTEKCEVLEDLYVNNSPKLSPDSSPSIIDAKHPEGHYSTPGNRNGRTDNKTVKRPAADNLGSTSLVVDHTTFHEDSFQEREPKKQKKLSYGLSEAVTGSHGHSQQSISHPDHASVSNCEEENKFKEDTSVISSTAICGSVCVFCQSSDITEGTGPLLHYADGKEVAREEAAFVNAIPVHSKCIEWAPQVYYDGETVKNLESELARASKLKCSGCGLKGAALGCLAKSCRRSYHLPCALFIPNCRWDLENFVMLCPAHRSIKLPYEKSKSRKDNGEKHSLPTQITSHQSNFWATSPNGPQEWVICGSALSSEEKCLLVKFAAACGATVFKSWNPNVTHVIAATDAEGASSRTLKVLMAILNGRWVLTMDWVKACLEANCPVNEEPYEVNLDNHGCRDGPRTGRIRASNNAPKLFDGLSFYFSGHFVPTNYKNDLFNLVKVGGGTITENLEQTRHHPQEISKTFVVYNRDIPCGDMANEESSLGRNRLAAINRSAEAKDVAKLIGAQVIPHTWILESIAASRVLPCPLP